MTKMTGWTPNYLRSIALHDLRFVWHAKKQMKARHISPTDVLLVLHMGEWEYADNGAIRIGFDVPGVSIKSEEIARHAGIYDVVIIMDAQTREIITVMRLYDPEFRRQGPRPS